LPEQLKIPLHALSAMFSFQ